MVIIDKVYSGSTSTACYVARTCIFLLGLGAAAWGGFFLPQFWRQAPVDRTVAKVLQGGTLKLPWLLNEVRQAEPAGQSSFCNPSMLHDGIVLRLAALETAIASVDQAYILSAYDPLYGATRAALACSPADSFMWLTLFWLEVGKHGYQATDADYLRLSYRLGPNEAWIALWRSQIAFALFDRLPSDLADEVLDEFVKLVDAGNLYPQTAAIFASASPVAQSRIVEHLKSVKVAPRYAFARALHDKGLDVAIPGVDLTPTRPWQ